MSLLQVLDKIAQEVDPEGLGVTYNDFEQVVSRIPDFACSMHVRL